MRTVPVEDDAFARCGGDVARDVEVHAVAVERHIVVPKVLHASQRRVSRCGKKGTGRGGRAHTSWRNMRMWGLELAAGCCWLGAGGGGGLGLGCCAGHAGGGGAGGGPRLAPKGQSGQANAAPALALRRQVGGLAEVVDSSTQARHLGSAVQAVQQASGVRISASVRYACAPRSVSGGAPREASGGAHLSAEADQPLHRHRAGGGRRRRGRAVGELRRRHQQQGCHGCTRVPGLTPEK